MKAKFYTLILTVVLQAGLPLKGQLADNRGYSNDGTHTVINNYYDNYDYYYSSRINRFHRSYAVFDYYSPVFTDTYWYSWQPYTWGVSIYGRSGFGFGYSINYPVYFGYNGWYDPYYEWYDPYYGSSWYRGYDPFNFSWYSPVIININLRSRWHNHWYWSGYDGWYYGYRPVHNNYNYYYNQPYSRYSNREFSNSHGYNNRTNGGGIERRQSVSVSGREADYPSNNRTNIGASTTSRSGGSAYPARGQNNSTNANNGNNQNSRIDGNNGNFDQNTHNTNNNGNNRNSQPGGNNGNFGNRNNGGEKGTAITPVRSQSSSSGRSAYNSPRTGSNSSAMQGRSASSSRSGSSARSSAPSRSGGSVRSSSSSRSGSGSVRSSSSSTSKSSGSSSRSSSSSSSGRSRR